MDGDFIFAAFADAVGNKFSVLGKSFKIHAGGVVSAERGGIEKHFLGSGRSSVHVQNKQILARGAFGIKIAAAPFDGEQDGVHFY
jgi:hypothetical protein